MHAIRELRADIRLTPKPANYLAGTVALCTLIGVLSPFAQGATLHAGPIGSQCTVRPCDCPPDDPCQLNATVLASLEAGDVLQLGAGEFDPITIDGLHGSELLPITVQGSRRPSGARATRFSTSRRGARDVIEIRRSSNIVLRDLLVSGGGRAGIRVNNSHDTRIERSEISNNGVWGIFTNHANGTRVTDNEVFGPGRQHGVYFSNSGDGGLIARNVVRNFDACGIQLNGDLGQGGAQAVTGDGVIADVTIRDNLIMDNGTAGGSAINLDGARDTTVMSNIFVGNKAAMVAMYKTDGGEPTSGTKVVENFIVGTPESRGLVVFADGATRNLIMGNIVISRSETEPVIHIKDVEPPGLLDRLRGRYLIRNEFIDNRYANRGPFARYGEDHLLQDFDDWLNASGDHSSSLLRIDGNVIARGEYRNILDTLRRLGPDSELLATNPHVDRLP